MIKEREVCSSYVDKVDELLLELLAAGRDFKDGGHC